MTLPPYWKIRREWLRFGRTLKSAPRVTWTYLFNTLYYDLILSRKRIGYDGHLPWTDRIAIFVIFPSQGLLETHLDTVRHLAQNGYTAVVVSNLPLSKTDREQLLEACSCYIERPNFGYDFGAYRDGVLSIQGRLDQLKRLVLINDSAWYPLPGKRNWVREAEDMGHDLVGATSNYGRPRRKSADIMEMELDHSLDHRNFHFASYALSFGPDVITHAQFLAYWKKLRLDNDKKRVVRRGEIGLSQWILRNGFSHKCMFETNELENTLNTLSDERLEALVQNIILLEHERAMSVKKGLLETPPAPQDRRSVYTRFILAATSLQGASYALADLLITEKEFPFLKKSPLRLSRDGADATLRILAKEPKPDLEVITQEALAIYAASSPSEN
ncbi:rhamnan synthesis F family protein [Tateyamaria sp.]|uniref:rhamnan synthesis F family protein n=1 Tax=Tateyamaria sp. TaxID=1929288 RepID=UPI00329F6BE5